MPKRVWRLDGKAFVVQVSWLFHTWYHIFIPFSACEAFLVNYSSMVDGRCNMRK